MSVIDNKYRINKNIKLGKGSFSEVYMGTNLITNEPVAIKVVDLSKNGNTIKSIKIEAEIMKKLDHPNIVKFYDLVKTDDYLYIIMEHCNYGTLSDVIKYNEEMHLKKSVTFSREANAYYYLNQLKNALDYVRMNNYVHRDIKPMNVLLSKPGIIDPDAKKDYHYSQNIIIKLADFGLARDYEQNSTSLMETICGSPLYMSPELLMGQEYNSLSDIWSYGVIMYELLFGIPPMTATSIGKFKELMRNKNIDFHTSRNLTPECFDLLRKILTKNYKSRINWDDFAIHKWFIIWADRFLKFKESNELIEFPGVSTNVFESIKLTSQSILSVPSKDLPNPDLIAIKNIDNPLLSSSGIKTQNKTDLVPIKIVLSNQKSSDKLTEGIDVIKISPIDQITEPNPLKSINSLREISPIEQFSKSPGLGSSNLTRMVVGSYSPKNFKPGSYSDYPASYPPKEPSHNTPRHSIRHFSTGNIEQERHAVSVQFRNSSSVGINNSLSNLSINNKNNEDKKTDVIDSTENLTFPLTDSNPNVNPLLTSSSIKKIMPEIKFIDNYLDTKKSDPIPIVNKNQHNK
jgi:serine/threonine protein kinase